MKQWKFKLMGGWKEEELCRSCLAFKNQVFMAIMYCKIT